MQATAEKTATRAKRISTAEKEVELRRLMRSYGSVLVAYSGGVDSTFLAAIAHEELGERSFSVSGLSPSVSDHQRSLAASTATLLGLNYHTIETFELDDENYRANGTDRCFFCKDELYKVLVSEAERFGARVVIDGTNADDLSDHRPGRKAAAGHGVRSPLAEVGYTKAEIRHTSRRMGLPTAEMPASPCLSSRIATGVPVTIERLGKVERAEAVLRSLGFCEFRVRVHGELARIEIALEEMPLMSAEGVSETVARELSSIGFRFVTLDLQGFRSGSTNGKGMDGDRI